MLACLEDKMDSKMAALVSAIAGQSKYSVRTSQASNVHSTLASLTVSLLVCRREPGLEMQ